MSSCAISIFGLGYVGSVMAACLAHQGHRVVGVDVSRAKVDAVNAGHTPIVEARMEELVRDGAAAGRLLATTDADFAVQTTAISFVCVGTPGQPDGKLDLTHVEMVSRAIGRAIGRKAGRHDVVMRSTVLPGSTESVIIPALEAASGKRVGEDLNVIYNPEFMREGSAVADFFDPAITVLGSRAPQSLAVVRGLYQGAAGRTFETSIKAAEMVKYASNAFHAVKVGFANEIGALAKRLGADTQAVMQIFASDERLNISPAYLRPAFAFGGSCLPKDVRALAYCAEEHGLRLPLLNSLLASNDEHIERAAKIVLHSGKKNVGILGLSFKAGTDDLRESAQVKLVKRLLQAGCEIRIWDPNVTLERLAGANRQYIESAIPEIGPLLGCDLKEVVEMADIVVVGSSEAAKEMIQESLRPDQKILDLVNLEKAGRPAGLPLYEGICW